MVVLLASVLLTIHRTGARRHFWVGFVLFGGCYLGLSLIPHIEARLISSKGLAFLHSKLPVRSSEIVDTNISWRLSGAPGHWAQTMRGQSFVRFYDASTGKWIRLWGSSTENFVRIGHSWLALLAAWIGGFLSRRLSRGSTASEAPAPMEGPG